MYRRIGWLVAISATLGGNLCLLAEENSSSKAQKPAPVHLTGRIVVIDPESKTCTVQIDKRIYLFALKPRMTIRKGAKKLSLKDLLAGQTITLTFMADRDQLEVISIRIIGSSRPAEAAGNDFLPDDRIQSASAGPLRSEEPRSGRSSATSPTDSGNAAQPPPAHPVLPHRRGEVSPFN